MTLGLNQEGIRQKYTYQKRLTNRSRKVGVDYATRIHLFEFSPLLQLTVTTAKLWGKKNGTKQSLINPQKMIA